MKKYFQALGLIMIFVLCFFSTEKTLLVVQEMDELMITMKQKKDAYTKKPLEATIVENTIIPGIAGKEVDLNKSYVKMKEYGKFDASLFIYKKIAPKETLSHNYDKFVIKGNPKKRMVSLLFRVDEGTDPGKILSILKSRNTRATFFIDGNWLEKNLDMLEEIVASGHSLGNLSYRGDYENSSFVWIDTMIKRLGKQSKSYCIAPKKEKKTLEICSIHEDTTVVPDIIVSHNILSQVKKEVTSGSIVLLPINEEVEKELGVLITYLNSRGYTLSNIENHLQE